MNDKIEGFISEALRSAYQEGKKAERQKTIEEIKKWAEKHWGTTENYLVEELLTNLTKHQ